MLAIHNLLTEILEIVNPLTFGKNVKICLKVDDNLP